MVSYERARSEESKAHRRESILQAAERVVLRGPGRPVRMEEVAAEAGVSKGTLYLYFGNREELRLALAIRELTAWLSEVDGSIRGNLAIRGPAPLAAAFSGTLARRPSLSVLLPDLKAALVADASGKGSGQTARLSLELRRLDALLFERLPHRTDASVFAPTSAALALLMGFAQGSAQLHSPSGYFGGDTGLKDVFADYGAMLEALFTSLAGTTAL